MFERPRKNQLEPQPPVTDLENAYVQTLIAIARKNGTDKDEHELRVRDEALRFIRDITYRMGKQQPGVFTPLGYTSAHMDTIIRTGQKLWDFPGTVKPFSVRRFQQPGNIALLDMHADYPIADRTAAYSLDARWDIRAVRPVRICLKRQTPGNPPESAQVDWVLLPADQLMDTVSISRSLGTYGLSRFGSEIVLENEQPILKISYPADGKQRTDRYIGITPYFDPASERHYTLFAAPAGNSSTQRSF